MQPRPQILSHSKHTPDARILSCVGFLENHHPMSETLPTQHFAADLMGHGKWPQGPAKLAGSLFIRWLRFQAHTCPSLSEPFPIV